MVSVLAMKAAEKARDTAEEFFKLGDIEMAIRSVTAAKEFNPELSQVDDYLAACKVHEMASKKKTWYEILSISDTAAECSIIRKHYKRLALILHPDKNRSIAADGAFKIIQSALEVLTNPEQRKAYHDNTFSSNNHNSKPTTQSSSNVNRRTSKPPPPTSSCNAAKRKTASEYWSQSQPQATDQHPSTSSSRFRSNDPAAESFHRRTVKIQNIKLSGRSGSRVDVVSRDSNDRVIFKSTSIQKPGDFIQIF